MVEKCFPQYISINSELGSLSELLLQATASISADE